MLPRVAVVIPNYNGRALLGPCLGALRKQTFSGFETIVVDDASTDGSAEFVEREFPEVRVVKQRCNVGFAAAVNAGIRALGSDFVSLLNNDTEPHPRWLEALVQAADVRPEAAIFASKLVSMQDKRYLDGAGDALRWSGLPYRLGHGEPDDGRYDEPGYVFGACAAAALYRRSLFEEIGLFDEDFFAYCEDADVSFRAQLAGFRCFYEPKAVVYHAGSASTGGKRSAFALRQGTQNGINLLVKNLPAPLVPKYAPLFFAGQLLRVLLTSTSPEKARANLSGLLGAGRLLPRMLNKRRSVQERRRIPTSRIEVLLLESFRRAAGSRARQLRDGFWG